jgi:hypothetical protein
VLRKCTVRLCAPSFAIHSIINGLPENAVLARSLVFTLVGT